MFLVKYKISESDVNAWCIYCTYMTICISVWRTWKKTNWLTFPCFIKVWRWWWPTLDENSIITRLYEHIYIYTSKSVGLNCVNRDISLQGEQVNIPINIWANLFTLSLEWSGIRQFQCPHTKVTSPWQSAVLSQPRTAGIDSVNCCVNAATPENYTLNKNI